MKSDFMKLIKQLFYFRNFCDDDSMFQITLIGFYELEIEIDLNACQFFLKFNSSNSLKWLHWKRQWEVHE